MRRIILVIGALVFVAGAYALWPERSPTVSITYGPYSAEGVLKQTDISLVRRGTHIFTATDGTELLAESSVINLQQLAGSRVKVTGTTSANTSPKYLPLLTVSSAEMIEAGASEKPVSSVALGLSIAIPSAWTTVESAGVLAVSTGTSTVLSIKAQPLKETLPAGTPVRIGGRNGIRQALSDGSVQITIPLVDRWIVFVIASGATSISPAPETMLQTVRFLVDARSSQSSSSSKISSVSGTGSGTTGGGSIVCGGAAGILCPAGQYCAIQDFATSTGVCKSR